MRKCYIVEVGTVIAGVYSTRVDAERLRKKILAAGEYYEIHVCEYLLDAEADWR